MTQPSDQSSAQPPAYVVAIGASAGGLEPVRELLAELPANLNAALVVAIHSQPSSQLTAVLSRNCQMTVETARDNEPLVGGRVYVLPGAVHGFFRDGTLRLSNVVEPSGFRPSIDALFMSMASEYGDNGIAVVLSGALDDGTRGARVVYDMGGRTIVQDPDDATYRSMPQKVIMRDHPVAVETPAELGQWIIEEVGTT